MKRLIFEEDHEMFRDSVRRFMQAEVGPHVEPHLGARILDVAAPFAGLVSQREAVSSFGVPSVHRVDSQKIRQHPGIAAVDPPGRAPQAIICSKVTTPHEIAIPP